MRIQVNQNVRLLDSNESGRVVAIDGTEAIVLLDHGFEERIALSQLIPAHDLSLDQDVVHKEESHGNKQPVSKPAMHKRKQKLEVDLHAGVLLGSTRGLSNHEIVLLQLDEAVKAIENARKTGIPMWYSFTERVQENYEQNCTND